jgi:acetyl-CoA acyltransferase
MTLNRFCASGLEAVALACAKVHAGMADVIVAFGVESMSRIPMGGHDLRPNPWLAAHKPGAYLGMGLTAENLAESHGISRQDQDAFALRSHRRAVSAQERGLWDDERVPYRIGDQVVLEVDEGPRADTSLEALAGLKPSFRQGGSVTAGNSSPLTDGAAAALVVGERALHDLGSRPLGRLAAYAVAGVDPEVMGIAPVHAVPRALENAGWNAGDLQHVELNEAFAAQSLAVIRQLGLDEEITNPQGGAVALGHPLGMSGARLVGTLLHAMRRNGHTRGLATLCVGGGMGAAAVFEAV